MKRILALVISTVLAVPLVSTAVIFAEGSTSTTGGTTTPTTNTETETQKPASADDTKALQARLEKRKAEFKIKLTDVEKLNIKNKCKASQGLVSSVKGRVKGIETSRSEVYANMINRLTDLSTKLKNKGANTTTLDADIAVLKTKIDSFKTDLATYKQAVSDLADIDCKTYPDLFQASLLAARSALETVNKDALAVRSYVNDTIKPELKKIRNALETDKSQKDQ